MAEPWRARLRESRPRLLTGWHVICGSRLRSDHPPGRDPTNDESIDAAMTRTFSPQFVITCPVCGSDGTTLHHDIRSSLLYFCERCLHEWQIDPAQEPFEVDPRAPSSGQPNSRGAAESPATTADEPRK
jgi:hypothetical protein